MEAMEVDKHTPAQPRFKRKRGENEVTGAKNEIPSCGQVTKKSKNQDITDLKNDYCQHFVSSGLRPQNFVRDEEASSILCYYPSFLKLIEKKDQRINDRACPAMSLRADLKKVELSQNTFGTRFDVILIDPPWEEYARRAPFAKDIVTWTDEEIMNLPIKELATTPCFVFLWVGSTEGLQRGRKCFENWGLKRIEDICWAKTNKQSKPLALVDDENTLLQRTKEHCLVGVQGRAKRELESEHLIHANVDTDLIITEEPEYGSTRKPQQLYGIIERFAQGGRRIELFGEDHNKRRGWLTVGDNITDPNFNRETYAQFFKDEKGNLCDSIVGAPHLVGSTEEIDYLRAWNGRISCELQKQKYPYQENYEHSLPTPEERQDQYKYLVQAYHWWMQWLQWLSRNDKEMKEEIRKQKTSVWWGEEKQRETALENKIQRRGIQWYEWERWYRMHCDWLGMQSCSSFAPVSSCEMWKKWTLYWLSTWVLPKPVEGQKPYFRSFDWDKEITASASQCEDYHHLVALNMKSKYINY